jgi:hypothetical protein
MLLLIMAPRDKTICGWRKPRNKRPLTNSNISDLRDWRDTFVQAGGIALESGNTSLAIKLLETASDFSRGLLSKKQLDYVDS